MICNQQGAICVEHRICSCKKKSTHSSGDTMESGFDHPGDDYGSNHTKQSRKGPKATGEEDHLPFRESMDRVAALADNFNHNQI